jgi:hypothetical protein
MAGSESVTAVTIPSDLPHTPRLRPPILDVAVAADCQIVVSGTHGRSGLAGRVPELGLHRCCPARAEGIVRKGRRSHRMFQTG